MGSRNVRYWRSGGTRDLMDSGCAGVTKSVKYQGCGFSGRGELVLWWNKGCGKMGVGEQGCAI